MSTFKSTLPYACVMCARAVVVESATGEDPETGPEMVRPTFPGVSAHGRPWIGFVAGEHTPALICACSDECLDRLLSASSERKT